jgi:hypothetical protein
MLKWFKRILVVVGLIVLGWSLWQNETKDRELILVNGKLYEVLSHQVDTVTVEIIKSEYRRGRDIEVIVEVPTYIPVDVDTASILKDYYSKRIYSDTLRIDSLGYVAIRDTISENRILGRFFDARINERTIRETTIVKELPKVEFYMGVAGRTDVSVGGVAFLKLPSLTQFGLEMGLSTQGKGGTPYIGGMILWPIK